MTQLNMVRKVFLLDMMIARDHYSWQRSISLTYRFFEFHDNAFVKYQNIQVELETQCKAAEGSAEEVRERPLEFYLPLIGTRHIDLYNGLLYETIDVKATKQRDIVAWRRRILNGRFQGKIQGPLHIHDIHK